MSDILENILSGDEKTETSLLSELISKAALIVKKMDNQVDDRSGVNVGDSNNDDAYLELGSSLKKWARTITHKFDDRVDSKSGKASYREKNVDREIDRIVDKGATLIKGSKFENWFNKLMGKETSKAGTKVATKAGTKTATKAGTKAVTKATTKAGTKVATKAATKAGTKVATKAAAKAGTKMATKLGGKALGKTLLKKVPVLSVVVGTYFAIGRCFKGEWKEAKAEFLSGVAGCIPGYGTAVSVALDVGLVASDLAKASKEQSEENKKSLDDVRRDIAERGENIRKANNSKSSTNAQVSDKKIEMVSQIADSYMERG